MKVSVADYERTVKDVEFRLDRERNDADAASKELTDARGKVENLATRTAQLERQLVVQTTEAEVLHKRVQELESKLGDQGRALAEREYEVDRLRGDIEAARKIESDLRVELASSTGHSTFAATEALRSEKSLVDTQLERAREDRAKLQREIATMKRDAEATWAAERVENARPARAHQRRRRRSRPPHRGARRPGLADRHDPRRPTPPRLGPGAASSGGTNVGINGQAGATIAGMAEEPKTTLADRIRALQTRASRVASSNWQRRCG